MLTSRPPIVVILGHVDHGKTTLLDYIRRTNIAARESGGITQAIRSFQLSTDNCPQITFIDTPGHAAFKTMRSRGSAVADFAVLVVAVNDGVMPQTKESIDFIHQAGIPFVVALNKSDLPDYDPAQIKTQLTQSGVVVEDLGGDVPAVSVSAKTGAGVSDLLDLLTLMSQLHPPQADPDGPLEAQVLEGRLDSQKGPQVVCIVKNGTLRTGQQLFQSQPAGKVRALIDSQGKKLTSAPPSTPVEILGLTTIPEVGSVLSDTPQPLTPSIPSRPSSAPTPDSATPKLIIKCDVAGSLEAILHSLPPTIIAISTGTGDVTDSDIELARTAPAVILAFNTKIPSSVAKLAQVEKVKIYSHRIIYELLDQVDKLQHPRTTEEVLGKATVVADFKIGPDRIAGCRLLEGTIKKTDTLRLLRDSLSLGETRLKSLKIGKSDTQSVKSGAEFGAIFSPYLDFRPGDTIIAYTIHGPS